MAGTGTLYFALSVDEDGRRIMDAGTLRVGRQWATRSGRAGEELIVVAPGEEVTVWAYSASMQGFTYLALISDAFAQYTVVSDRPTSATDKTPLGTHVRTSILALDSIYDYPINERGYDSAGVLGYVYEVKVKNPNAAALRVRVVIVD